MSADELQQAEEHMNAVFVLLETTGPCIGNQEIEIKHSEASGEFGCTLCLR
jgi:hypothetical protein